MSQLKKLIAACRRATSEFMKVSVSMSGSVFTENSLEAAGRRAGIEPKVTTTKADFAERERRDKQVLQIDQALHEFTEVMRAKMLRNLHKGDWQTAPFELLWDRAMLEIEELRIARKYETSDDARKECADVANFMMILFVRFAREGTLMEQAKKPITKPTEDEKRRELSRLLAEGPGSI